MTQHKIPPPARGVDSALYYASITGTLLGAIEIAVARLDELAKGGRLSAEDIARIVKELDGATERATAVAHELRTRT